jgi:plastocyanin
MILLIPLISAAVGPTTVNGTVSLDNGRPAKMAVIWLQGEEKAEAQADAMVDQRDRTFIPHVSVVTVGTKVRFPNNDTVFHNVFTEFHSTKFDLGMYARGTTKTQTFTRTGLAVLMCSVHPQMSAYIMVVDTPYFAVSDSFGKFKIAKVPPGSYHVQVWQESGQKLDRQLDVSPSGQMNLVLQR